VITATLLVKFFIGIAPFYDVLLPDRNKLSATGDVYFSLAYYNSVKI